MTTPNPPSPVRYDGPPAPDRVAERLGIPVERIVKLDANESPYGPPPAALAALADLARAGGGGRYPDAAARALCGALETYTGVATARIVVGNGSDELIALLADLLLEPDDEVMVSEPTFAAYALAATRRFARVVDAGRGGDDFTPDPERIAAAMNSNTRIVFLCGPNNPTGTPLPRETLLAVLARAEELSRHGAGPVVVLDEAYYEIGALGGDPNAWTAAPLLSGGRRLVVLRTFSKLFGLAGLRVGYALCPEDIASHLRERKQPYNVNSAGQSAATAALSNIPWLRERAVALLHERERLFAALAGFPSLRAFPSSANFLLVRAGGDDAAPLWQGLLDRGILVRRFSGERMQSYLRITVGTPEQNDALLAALTTICAKGMPDE